MNQFFHFKHEELKDFNEALAIIKSEGPGPKFEDDNFQIIKKEETVENEFDPLSNFSFIENVNQRFDLYLSSLNQYLQNFVDVEDFIVNSNALNEKETQEMVAEAKVHFKEWGEDIINSLSESLKQKAVQHFLPESYIVQLVEITKRRIFNSFKQLKKNLAELVSDSIGTVNKTKKIGTKPKKKVGKKKSDFPQQARTLLKAWFIAHAQDPYPSHEEKINLAREGGISMKQLENWLTNTRGRIWKKMQDEPKFDSEIEKILMNNGDEDLF